MPKPPGQNSGPKVLVVDDHAASREALHIVLDLAGLSVVGEAADGLQALGLIESLKPDIVLTDLKMPSMDGVSLIKAVKARWPEIRIVALSMAEDRLGAAMEAGADAGVLKGSPTSALLAAIARANPTGSWREQWIQ